MDTKRFNTPQYKRQVQAVRTYRRPIHRETQERNFSWVYWVLGLLVLAGLVYLIYFARFLQIKGAEITGADSAETAAIQQHLEDFKKEPVLKIFPQKNVIFFDTSKFKNYLSVNDFGISRVNSVKKAIGPNKIKIDIIQRVPQFILMSGGKFYILNSDGNISSEIEQLANYPLVEDTSNEEIRLGDNIFNEKQREMANFILSHFQNSLGSAIDHFEIAHKQGDDMKAWSKNGFAVYFSADQDIAESFQELLTLWATFTADQQKKVYYIDMRYAKNAYVCFKGDPCEISSAALEPQSSAAGGEQK